MEITMKITDPEEIKAIETIRKEKAKKKLQDMVRLHVLKHAFGYEEWLQKNGMRGSYSVFCDNYGYKFCPFDGISRIDLYDRIVSVLSMARGPEKVTLN